MMQKFPQKSEPTNTAVLFLVFNRPNTTKQVFEAIRQAKPPRLYVAADGARKWREGEAERVDQVREIATAVDWPCELKILFREKNLGCKEAVSSAIDWFFQHEEQGIILEDDCLPHQDFFLFCDTLLHYYANEERVWVITGDNFQDGKLRGEGSYYFSRYNHVWGWASWRRAWIKCDMKVSFWPEWKKSMRWRDFLADKVERKYWTNIFDRMHLEEIDTWDYPWTASVWYHGGLTATPNVNLISNIGFGVDATHTTLVNSQMASKKFGPIGNLIHPSKIEFDFAADKYVFDYIFDGRHMKFPNSLIMMPRKFAGNIYRFLKKFINHQHH